MFHRLSHIAQHTTDSLATQTWSPKKYNVIHHFVFLFQWSILHWLLCLSPKSILIIPWLHILCMFVHKNWIGTQSSTLWTCTFLSFVAHFNSVTAVDNKIHRLWIIHWKLNHVWTLIIANQHCWLFHSSLFIFLSFSCDFFLNEKIWETPTTCSCDNMHHDFGLQWNARSPAQLCWHEEIFEVAHANFPR